MLRAIASRAAPLRGSSPQTAPLCTRSNQNSSGARGLITPLCAHNRLLRVRNGRRRGPGSAAAGRGPSCAPCRLALGKATAPVSAGLPCRAAAQVKECNGWRLTSDRRRSSSQPGRTLSNSGRGRGASSPPSTRASTAPSACARQLTPSPVSSHERSRMSAARRG